MNLKVCYSVYSKISIHFSRGCVLDMHTRALISWAGLWSSMYWQYYCTASTNVLAEGAARVPEYFDVRPTITPHKTAETHQNSLRKS